jgi:hypothetical protein
MLIINLNFYASVSNKVGRGILLRSLALIKNDINFNTTLVSIYNKEELRR